MTGVSHTSSKNCPHLVNSLNSWNSNNLLLWANSLLPTDSFLALVHFSCSPLHIPVPSSSTLSPFISLPNSLMSCWVMQGCRALLFLWQPAGNVTLLRVILQHNLVADWDNCSFSFLSSTEYDKSKELSPRHENKKQGHGKSFDRFQKSCFGF